MFDPIILSIFMFVPVLGILISSLFTFFIQNQKLLIVEQITSVGFFFCNVIIIGIMVISFGRGVDMPSSIIFWGPLLNFFYGHRYEN